MNQYVLIFRMDITTPESQPTAEQMELYMKQWMAWINSISAKGQLADGGNHLVSHGVVLRPNDIRDNKPYTVNKESVAGYIIILAASMDEAIAIARQCPILNGEGTSVEVRQAADLNAAE